MRRGFNHIIPIASVIVAIALPACATDLTREQAREILDKKLAVSGTVTRDVPLGPGMHIGLSSAGDFGAPIRSDMLAIYRTMEKLGFIRLEDRGALQGWGEAVHTFDGSLTAEGSNALGELKHGRPDYSSASAYPLPPSFLTIVICKKKVKEITGIRIVKPGVEVQVEYSWSCEPVSEIGEALGRTRKDFMPSGPPMKPSGDGSVSLALYDDGWRVSEAR
jgi:hypothetical protein